MKQAQFPCLHVAVAVVEDSEGQILISKRLDHLHQGGLWEFPGGKVEAGESVQRALCRELQEETGIFISVQRPLIKIYHDYADKHVCLDVWLTKLKSGEAQGLEGQPLTWVSRAQLADYSFPAGNQAILTALSLPTNYLITPEPDAYLFTEFLSLLAETLDEGVQLVQLRANSLDEQAYRKLAIEVVELCGKFNARLLLKGNLNLLEAFPDAAGLHLTSEQLVHFAESDRKTDSLRPHLGLAADKLLAASCHNAEQISQAHKLGVDFITLSPLFATSSHPEAQALGWKCFESLLVDSPVPVYGLGGLSAAHQPELLQRGAQGYAAISSLWPTEV